MIVAEGLLVAVAVANWNLVLRLNTNWRGLVPAPALVLVLMDVTSAVTTAATVHWLICIRELEEETDKVETAKKKLSNHAVEIRTFFDEFDTLTKHRVRTCCFCNAFACTLSM